MIRSEQQMDLITACAAKFAEERGVFKMLVLVMFYAQPCGIKRLVKTDGY